MGDGAMTYHGEDVRILRYRAIDNEDPTPPVLKPATVAAMITDQNRGLNTPWGIGWMLRGLGKHSSPRTFGATFSRHW